MTTLNNIYSTNAIKSFSYFVKDPELRVNNLKTGTLKINGIKIKIDSKDSLEIVARKINAKKKYTQIEAQIIKSNSGYRLILCSRKQKVDIIDYDTVLLNLHKKKLLGINDKCLIQIVGKRNGYESNDIIINYKHITKESIVNNQILDESNKLILSTLKFITPLVSRNKFITPLVSLNEARNQTEIPVDNFDEIVPELLETVQPIEGRLISSLDNVVTLNNTVEVSNAVLHIAYKSKSPVSSNPPIQRHTLTWRKGEYVGEFNKVMNYVFAHTSVNRRRLFGLLADKENIKYTSRADLNIPGKLLTNSEKTTKKLYEVYDVLSGAHLI